MIFKKEDLRFKRLGYMVDCSRGAVPKVSALKKLADYLSAFGYTYLELYTEDTYEIEGEPYFGYMRGRYTKEEISDLAEYCAGKGMELIPCIQTLAHLERIKIYGDYADLFEISNILTVGDERVYSLIEKMLKTVSENFGAKRVHVGMDEAYLLGRGKLLDKKGREDSCEIMRRHLGKVAEIAQKLGLTVEMWSDMFTENYHPLQEECRPEDGKLVPSIGQGIPENVEPVMWTYIDRADDDLNNFILKNKALGKKTVFAGGAWKWMGFIPDNAYSIETVRKQIKKCVKHEVEGFMLTAWGDGAADASVFSVLPAAFATAVYAYGKDLDEHTKSSFYKTVGTPFDSFMLLDKPNKPKDKKYVKLNNQSFVYFYNDVLQGVADSIVPPDAKYLYVSVSEQVRKVKCGKDFKYLFASLKAYTDFVAEKSTIGKKAYEAYIAKENDGLKACVKRLENAVKLLDVFISAYTERWHEENKSFGFEKQLIRLGGLKQRLLYARDRIKLYLSGKIATIEEFEVKRLPLGLVGCDENTTCEDVIINNFNLLSSAGGLMGDLG